MTAPYDPEDEWDGDLGDDLAAALDFSAPSEDDDSFYGGIGVSKESVGYVDLYDAQEKPEDLGPLFSVTNPPGTLTATAFIDGSIQRVEISPSVTGMTESELAQELLAIAKVAAMKAQAGQYEFLLEATPQEVGEREFLGEFLHHAVGLPTPEQAAQVEAEFVQQYLRDDT